MAEDGTYQFSYPPLVWNEVIGEAENCISWHLAKQLGHAPEAGQKVEIVASINPMEDATTTLRLEEIEDFGSTYFDEISQTETWLCPLVDTLFGLYPSELYVRIRPKVNNNETHETRRTR